MMGRRVLTALAVLAIGGSTALRADFKWFDNYCSVGTMRSCVSMQVFTTQVGSTTSVQIRVRNNQGSPQPWIPDNTGGSWVTRIGLVAPAGITAVTSSLSVSTLGPVTDVGGAGAGWTLRDPGVVGGLIELDATTANRVGAIRGCNTPTGSTPSSYFVTCGGGWVVFSFTTSNLWSANNAQIAFLSGSYTNFSGAGMECDSQGGIPESGTGGRQSCVSVTPEPITMLLLGSGLAGVGGVGLIRRRRGHDVESA